MEIALETLIIYGVSDIINEKITHMAKNSKDNIALPNWRKKNAK